MKCFRAHLENPRAPGHPWEFYYDVEANTEEAARDLLQSYWPACIINSISERGAPPALDDGSKKS